jgi:hypothetical protein
MSRLAVVVGASTPPPPPDWGVLRWFWISAIAAFVLALIAWLALAKPKDKAAVNLTWPLALDSKWSFKDRWAANATVASGIIAAFFGTTDTLNKVFGDNAAHVLAAIYISTAAAAALTVAAPLILAATTRSDGSNTGVGFLIAAFVTTTAAGGQIGAIAQSSRKLDFGGYQKAWPVILAIVGALLLVVYFLRTVPRILSFARDPKPSAAKALAQPETVQAAAQAVVDLGERATDVDAVHKAISDVAASPPSEPAKPRSLIL